MARTAQDAPSGEPDAGPAEDLSGDDDLLNHVLVNTIAQSNSKGIGVHPQTVGYTGPIVACDEVLDILQKVSRLLPIYASYLRRIARYRARRYSGSFKTVPTVRLGDLSSVAGVAKLTRRWSVLKAHLDTRQTGTQKGRFIK